MVHHEFSNSRLWIWLWRSKTKFVNFPNYAGLHFGDKTKAKTSQNRSSLRRDLGLRLAQELLLRFSVLMRAPVSVLWPRTGWS